MSNVSNVKAKKQKRDFPVKIRRVKETGIPTSGDGKNKRAFEGL